MKCPYFLNGFKIYLRNEKSLFSKCSMLPIQIISIDTIIKPVEVLVQDSMFKPILIKH